MKTNYIGIIFCLSCCYFVNSKQVNGEEKTSLHVNFDHHESGKYSKKKILLDWKSLAWEHCSRAQIVSNNGPGEFRSGKALRVTYPAGKIGSRESGAQFRVRLQPREEYVFEYYVRFGHGNGSHWDFSRGGKLPGLGGGKCNTGGNKTTGDGWTARYMWREKGALVLYLYHLDQKTKYGDQIPIIQNSKAGKWIRLTQRIRLNTDSKANGIVQVWVDGKLELDRQDIRFRHDDQAPIDRIVFNTFYGGSERTWAPKETSLAYFDEFRLAPKLFDDLQEKGRAGTRLPILGKVSLCRSLGLPHFVSGSSLIAMFRNGTGSLCPAKPK